MSMFSIHYLIRRGELWWNGGAPSKKESWVAYDRPAVRFRSKGSAELVLRGVLASVAHECAIEEDE